LLLSNAAFSQTPPDTEVTARFIVKFKDSTTKAAVSDTQRVARLATNSGVALQHLRPMALGANVVVLDHEVSIDEAEAIAARLASDPDIEFAEPDRLRKPLLHPNDTLIGAQTYLADSAAAIGAFSAWDVTTGDPNTVIASIDTGIRPHAGLVGRILPGYDFISDPAIANDGGGRDADGSDPGDWITQADVNGAFKGRNCTVENSSWHGTMTSGVMAANSNDGAWTAGINWAAKILPIRVLGKCGGYDSDIADGMTWAGGLSVPNVPANPTPAQVINLSLGGTGKCGTTYSRAVNAILAHGVTRAIVVAAGNENMDASNDVPASCPGVIAVAATSVTGQKASYSNYGSTVAIAAPGGDSNSKSTLIVALSNTGTTTPQADTTEYVAGTSFSAPVVAGVASLVLAVAPQITAAQMRSLLTSNAKPFPVGSSCTTALCGAGIVDANATVRAAAALAGPASTVNAIEFYNASLDHYFLTPASSEIAALDAGITISGWTRTGYSFKVYAQPTSGANPVCRFLIPPVHGDSHFFSADPAECARILAYSTSSSVTFDPNFSDYLEESSAFFYIALPDPATGACATGTVPVYRLWDRRIDSNHRYTTDTAVRNQMLGRGYVIEGYGAGPYPTIMCSPQ
jgi:serine protease